MKKLILIFLLFASTTFGNFELSDGVARFLSPDGTRYTSIRPIPTPGVNIDWIWPIGYGTANQALITDGSTNVLSWGSTPFDGTGLDDITWSDGTNASNVWTFDVSGTDHTMTAGNGLMTFSDDLTVTGTITGGTLTDGTASLTGGVGTDYTLTAPDINGGTVDAITSLTVANNVDIGNYTLTANGLTIDGTFTDGTLSIVGGEILNAITLEATTTLGIEIGDVQQLVLTDGKLNPTTDDDIDLGDATHEFKSAWFDGTVNIDSLVADTADINGGTLDAAVIGGTTAAAGTFTTCDATTDFTIGDTVITDGSVTDSTGLNVNEVLISANGNVLLPAGAAAVGRYPLKFTAGTALTTPETGVLEFHDSRLYMTNKSVRKAIDRTSDVKLSTTTVASTTTETEVYEALVPANSWVAGNVLKVLMSGTLSNKVGSAGHTVTIKVYSGTDEISTVTSTAAKFTDVCWHISGCAIVRDVGATGHMAYHLDMVIDGDNGTVTCDVVEIDTTGALDITVTATWASADDANIFTCDMGIMEYKN